MDSPDPKSSDRERQVLLFEIMKGKGSRGGGGQQEIGGKIMCED